MSRSAVHSDSLVAGAAICVLCQEGGFDPPLLADAGFETSATGPVGLCRWHLAALLEDATGSKIINMMRQWDTMKAAHETLRQEKNLRQSLSKGSAKGKRR